MSAPRRLTRVLTERDAGQRLDLLLNAWLPEALSIALSKSAIRRLIMAGAVAVRGRPQRKPGLALSAGDRVEVRVQPERLAPPKDAAFVVTPAQILFEDDWLIAVDKPSGIATVPTADASRPHVVGAAAAYLQSAYVGVHQRLDRETSGVLLFTKNPEANPALARAFAARDVEKTYHALVRRPKSGPEQAAWQSREPIASQAAETDFRLVDGAFATVLLLEARPRTGRKHQIRLHLAGAGMPIVGDARYGGPGASRLMLHAVRLALPHPRTGATLAIESPYPADFQRVLDAAR